MGLNSLQWSLAEDKKSPLAREVLKNQSLRKSAYGDGIQYSKESVWSNSLILNVFFLKCVEGTCFPVVIHCI